MATPLRSLKSPKRNKRKITPYHVQDTPSPQLPYRDTFSPTRPSTGYRMDRSPIFQGQQQGEPIRPLSVKSAPKKHNSNSGFLMSTHSSRFFQVMNERSQRYESSLEGFLHKAAEMPLYQAVESLIEEELKAESVTFWQDIPSLQLLFSEKHSKSVGHTRGIIGHTFFTRQSIKMEHANDHSAFLPEIDGIAGKENQPMMFFPLWDYSTTVCGVVQVVKEEGEKFDSIDEEFVSYFIKKFKVFSHWFGDVPMPHVVLLELLQIMEIEQFLLLFQKKLTQIFNCESAEVWRHDLVAGQMCQYKRIKTDIADGNAGIVGEAFRKSILINCESCKMRSSYYEPIDGPADQPVLVLPVIDNVNSIHYAIALRGKRVQPVFYFNDEVLLRKIAPYLLLSFANIEKYSLKGKDARFNQGEHNCVRDLKEVTNKIEKAELPTDKVVICAMEKLERLTASDRCSLFLYNPKKDKLESLYHSGLKKPISIPLERGVVGKTFRESVIHNIPDAYEDIHFDSTIDLESGYRTKTLLSYPLITPKHETIGVIQLLNKLDGKPFSNIDISFVQIYGAYCASLIDGERVHEQNLLINERINALLCIANAFSTNNSPKDILQEVMKNARIACDCDCSSLFIVDDVLSVLTSYLVYGGKVPATLPLSHGIAAIAVKTKTSIIVNDPYHDPRFNKTIDINTGFQTKCALAVPVKTPQNDVLAVIELINKKNNEFNEIDLQMMEAFAAHVSIAIELRRYKNIVAKGSSEIEMNKWVGEVERKSFITPQRLEIIQQKQSCLTTRDFFCIDWNGIGLFKIAFYIFNLFGLFQKYQITNELFFVFLYNLRATYNDVPYHNWIHAIDVLQFYIYQIKKCNFDQMLTGLELLAISVACLTHDVGHLGLSNEYLENTKHPIGILYKGISPSERYHCSKLIELTNQRGCNIFHALPEPELAKLWSWIIHLILATDMSRNSKIIKQANDIMDEGPINLSNESHRLVAMALMMNAANISNVCRPFQTADQWVSALLDEFYAQGDLEAGHKMEYSNPMNDRDSNVKEQCQILYISDVCMPLFHVVARIFGELESNIDMVLQNLEKWKEIKKQSDKVKQAETGEETEE